MKEEINEIKKTNKQKEDVIMEVENERDQLKEKLRNTEVEKKAMKTEKGVLAVDE